MRIEIDAGTNCSNDDSREMGQSDRKISHDIGNNGGTLSDTNPFVTKLNRSVVELLRRFLKENGRFSWLVLEEEYNLRLWLWVDCGKPK
ncbi:hypothetical protein ALC53_10705 [Atta colombica]|uniref:Uncharacterized protein n=1 Tax=Atta colombica TaxID=520822 RepID=A0A151I045_9HYME|nr:hypothetical protein ALC53_10705 [Atta colombica]